MKKLALTTIAAAAVVATVSMLSAPSFADTVADNEPTFTKTSVNRSAKTDLASAAFKTYRGQSDIAAFDRRYKERGQGMADPR